MISAIAKTDLTAIVIIDMLYDFIDGTLACEGAELAARRAAAFLENNPKLKAYYVVDTHPSNHCSFKEYGGIWPVNCVDGTRGDSIHAAFYSLSNTDNRPQMENIYRKGMAPDDDSYSGMSGETAFGSELAKALPRKVLVCGNATEYGLKATCEDLLETGHDVTVVEDALGYFSKEGHDEAIAAMKERGVKFMIAVKYD
ncbi:MAG: isochorismatase family protein [Bacteroidales bacterium]|nr:isochorismatase family protein [Bacteroidales bacterium]